MIFYQRLKMQLDTKLAELIELEQFCLIPFTRDHESSIRMEGKTWLLRIGKYPAKACPFSDRQGSIFNFYNSQNQPMINIYHLKGNTIGFTRDYKYNTYEVDNLAEEFVGDLLKFSADLEFVESWELKTIRISSFAKHIPKAALNTD